MRIDQLQNLTRFANVLLLGGMVYVGYLFYGAQTSRADVRTAEWPEDVKVRSTVSAWPPAMPQFVHIYKTPVNGLVPPPVVVKETVKGPPPDPWAEFKKQIVYKSAWIWPDPFSTMVQFEYPRGQEVTFRLGEKIGPDWQFVGFATVPRTNIMEAEKLELCFRYLRDDTVYTDVVSGAKPELADGLLAPAAPKYLDPIADNTVSESKLPVQAYFSKERSSWIVPRFEVAWWRAFGPKAFAAAKVEFQSGNETVRAGVLFSDSINAHPTLTGKRGISIGDLVVSVNGEPVTSVEHLLRHFQGRAPGAETFTLTIVNSGQERSETYVLEPVSDEQS
jgi:hypothetical protein